MAVSVYVDTLRISATVPNGPGRSVSGQWTHMMADTVGELEQMARRLGLDPAWRQDKRSGVHYDLVESRRARAVALGAIEIESGSAQWQAVHQVAMEQYNYLDRTGKLRGGDGPW